MKLRALMVTALRERAVRLLPLMMAIVGLAGTPNVRSAALPEGAARTHTVEIRDFAFSPARLEVARGDTIVWINRDAAPHTATDSLGGWDSGQLAAGARWAWVANEAGRFPYVCAHHPSMTGVVHVRNGGATGARL